MIDLEAFKSSIGFLKGDMIRVLPNPNKDETFNSDFIGEFGVIMYFDYECGCGQSYPNDPMIGIQFSNGQMEEFWKEEIQAT